VIVLLDASVLYPAPLRDLWMNLAVLDVIQARWTHEIHAEWVRNVLKNRPDLTPSQIMRTKSLMDIYVRDALVVGYEHLKSGLQLPDPNDCHVLAAAIQAQAKLIITSNLKHFPNHDLVLFSMMAWHPDQLVLHLLKTNPIGLLAGLRQQRANLRKPPITAFQMLNMLSKVGLINSALLLEEFASDF
jgi:predicted nucleic acid-binding protein